MLIESVLLIVGLLLLAYWYITKNYGYFKSHGIPELPGTFPFGSDSSWSFFLGKECALKALDKPQREKLRDVPIYGVYMFGQRQLIVTDIELVKAIAIKDADHFIDRMTFGVKYEEAHEEVDKLFGMFLTNMTGDAWKRMRTMTSPVFTSGKLKLMVPHINKVRIPTCTH